MYCEFLSSADVTYLRPEYFMFLLSLRALFVLLLNPTFLQLRLSVAVCSLRNLTGGSVIGYDFPYPVVFILVSYFALAGRKGS